MGATTFARWIEKISSFDFEIHTKPKSAYIAALHARDHTRNIYLSWLPVISRKDGNETLQTADLQNVTNVLSHSWADGTLGTYGSGLVVFHCYCDSRNIPESIRAPASADLLASFLAAVAGLYAGKTLENYLSGVRAWHILHGVSWAPNKAECEALLRAAATLQPKYSHKKKRQPYTLDIILSILSHLDPDVPFDAAVGSCLTTCFYSCGRVGEFTVKTLQSFDPSSHAKPSDVREECFAPFLSPVVPETCTNAALGLGLISWCFPPACSRPGWYQSPSVVLRPFPAGAMVFSTASVVLSVVRAGFPGSLVEEYLIFESCARIPGESHITTDFLPLNIPTKSPTASVVLRASYIATDFLPFNTHQVPPPPASCSALFLAGAMVLSWRNTGNCIFESDSGYIVTDFLSFNILTRSPTARIILGAEVLPPPRTWQEARARHSPPVTGVPELPGQSRFSIAATSASGPATIQKAKGLKPCSPPWTFATSSAEMPLPPLISPASKMPSRASIHTTVGTTVDLLRSSVETRVTAPPPSIHSAPPSGIHTPVKLHLAPAVRPQLQEFLADQGKRALCSMISPIP
ncbi:hypothetical protein B0H14DRAFT_3444908 [Mycena olivaceomarginata]|nr:hypothetical protein B0H14DRAFT_3444908 [Mycena olivaceomarginata]